MKRGKQGGTGGWIISIIRLLNWRLKSWSLFSITSIIEWTGNSSQPRVVWLGCRQLNNTGKYYLHCKKLLNLSYKTWIHNQRRRFANRVPSLKEQAYTAVNLPESMMSRWELLE